MKKFIFSFLFLLFFIALGAQVDRTDVLQNLEKSQPVKQNQQVTATLKSASRLFKEKDDLTSVIMIIPSDSVVDVLGSDSTYLNVVFEENEGYIYKRDAIINKPPVEINPPTQQENQNQVDQPSAEQKQVDRFTYLENKYGTDIAARLASGKIWRGMPAEMVRDSWGSPLKINRVIGRIIKEEWIYRNTWLYIENNTLVDWGRIPLRR